MKYKIPTVYKLRGYQEGLISAVFEQWQQHPRVMMQLPTGGGKTICFGAIANEFIRQNEQVLILAHREELVIQASEKVSAIAQCPSGIIKAGYKPDYDASLQVASVQSLVNRLSILEAPGLIVVDEAHHATAATYRRILGAYPDSYVLGVTATPTRLDGSGFRDLFDVLVCGPTVQQLIDGGYLSQFKLYANSIPMKVEGVRTRQGDYVAGDLAKANDAIELSGNLIHSYLTHCPGKRCVVFCVNVDHSKAIAARYNASGIPAIHLDGNTPNEYRRDGLQRFAVGDIKVITNCSLFDEGLDIPALEAVQIAKPTKSLVLWLQMVGRSLRPAKGKDHAIILDHTKNWAIHGLPTRERIWTLDGVQIQEKAIEVTDNYEVVEKPLDIQIAESETDLDVIEDELKTWENIYRELLEIQRKRGYKKSWIYYQLTNLRAPLEIWKTYAEYLGYKTGWAWHKYKEQEEAA